MGQPLTQTGRADLLRALAAGLRGPLALDSRDRLWWGYERRPEASPERDAQRFTTIELPQGAQLAAAAAAAPDEPVRLPLRMPASWVVTHVQPKSMSAEKAISRTPLAPSAMLPQIARRQVAYQDLVPWARLTPVLQRWLSRSRAGALDLVQIGEQLARLQLPRHLPRRHLDGWHPGIVVALDFSSRLWPYRFDMHRLCRELHRHCGQSGLALRVLRDGLGGGHVSWSGDADRYREQSFPESWGSLPPGSLVLVVGDLGLLDPLPELRAGWAAFVGTLQQQGHRVLALAPLGEEQVDTTLAARLPILRWSPDSRFHPARAAVRSADAEPAGLRDLLALVAAANRVDPPLLRELRRLLPNCGLNAGLEGAVWAHSEVAAGVSCRIAATAEAKHLQRFSTLDPLLQQRQRWLRQQHHRHLRAAVNHAENLRWAAQADEPGAQAESDVRAAIDFLGGLAARLRNVAANEQGGHWVLLAETLLQQADEFTATRFDSLFTELAAALAAATDRTAPASKSEPELWLVEDRHGLVLTSTTEFMFGQAPLHRLQSALNFVWGPPAGPRRTCFGVRHMVLWPSDRKATRLRLETERETVELMRVDRPRGAEGWCQGAQGLRVSAPSPALPIAWIWRDRDLKVDNEGNLVASTKVVPRVSVRQGPQASFSAGLDGFGTWLDIQLPGNGSPTQRLRRLDPGCFLMGSAPRQGGRNEHPQHAVTLTKGLWLADTPCTQAFWQAVMGRNPSEFKSGSDAPQRPVENVSWNDVRPFLAKLQAWLPVGCEALLPTEAQWEYAARAGTPYLYWWGDQADDERANWEDQHHGTTAVKRFGPNPWGLYDVHGNVWEWCADGFRTYDERAVVDPFAPAKSGEPRAVRGGSRGSHPARSRSASRSHDGPGGGRWDSRGFRLALMSRDQIPERPGAPGLVASAPRPAKPAHERGEGLIARLRSYFKRRPDDKDSNT